MNPAQPFHSGAHATTSSKAQVAVHKPLLPRLSQYATVALVALFALFLVLVATLAVYGATRSEKAYAGVSIAGVDVSGQSRSEISARVDSSFYEYQQQPVALVANGETFVTSLQNLGVTIDKDATIERAMNYGRSGSFWDRS
ncbi:MAG: hypothetical protein WKF81_03305, partial [Thermomicrobiales bacterium]